MSRTIIQKDDAICYVCGDSGALEEHHIFGGPNRKLSEHYGLKVNLCHLCHNEPPEGAHHNQSLMRELQAVGQLAFEKKYGHDRFIQEFGMDYIEAGLCEGYLQKIGCGLVGKYGLLK